MGSKAPDTDDETYETNTQGFERLSAFQKRIVYAIAANGGTPDAAPEMCPYGLAVKEQLEAWSNDEVNHGSLYPNVDDLVELGYVTKHQLDKRTNGLRVTDACVVAIVRYHAKVEVPALQALELYDRIVPPEVVDSGVLE